MVRPHSHATNGGIDNNLSEAGTNKVRSKKLAPGGEPYGEESSTNRFGKRGLAFCRTELWALVFLSTSIGTLALMFAAVLSFWTYYQNWQRPFSSRQRKK